VADPAEHNAGTLKALAETLSDAAWHTLNHDNDPHDGQEHNTANWKLLRNRLWAILKNHEKRQRRATDKRKETPPTPPDTSCGTRP